MAKQKNPTKPKATKTKPKSGPRNSRCPKDKLVKTGLDRMVEIEQFVSRLTTFLTANGVRLKVERKSDHELLPEDEVAKLVFEDGTELMVTEHLRGGFMETFLCGAPYADRTHQKVPHGPRVTGHDQGKKNVVDKIGYLA